MVKNNVYVYVWACTYIYLCVFLCNIIEIIALISCFLYVIHKISAERILLIVQIII